ncbi:ABC transporter permease [Salinisphaera sp.]|uniref:ABC transporter permease n=1 Tax=Salinisphaera sp. TaxID=1914330 RepID=UPI002D786257|nr:ABC transporter permease [Salinisphaera sp.]HET7315041.1 ABC transporter permease [Salinisphaera sp.]
MTAIKRNPATVGVFIGTVVIFLLSGLIEPGLLGGDSFRLVVLLSTFVIIVGFGQGIVILTGGLDLSVGSIITLGGVLLGSWVPQSNAGLWWAIPAVLLIGAGIGALSGIGVTVLKMPAFVMTLAMGIIVQSAILGYTHGAPAANSAPTLISGVIENSWLGVPVIIVLTLIFVIVGSVIQDKSAFGRLVHAVGSNPKAARIGGLPTGRVIVASYALSGCCAALCGVVLLGFIGAPTLSMGNPYTIESIAAVVVGGSSILGGRGLFLSTVGGALFLGVLSNDMTAIGLSAGWRTLVEGGIIVGALALFKVFETGGFVKLGRAFFPNAPRK